MKLLTIAGARPNFMKVSPLVAAMNSRCIENVLVHTGQHYDFNMSDSFFSDLHIPKPDYNLWVGSVPDQVTAIQKALKPILRQEKPDAVVVVGDANSTLAGALAAVREGIRVAHVEAGLRSFNYDMGEEFNRIVTDRISRWFFTTEAICTENLLADCLDSSNIHFTGNVMIDTLNKFMKEIKNNTKYKDLGLEKKGYALFTSHRPETVDYKGLLIKLIYILESVSKHLPVVFPLHPRTRISLVRNGLFSKLINLKNIQLVDPLRYIEFQNLMVNSKFVVTDSGGVQEESTAMGVPCLTIREDTERPVTIKTGTNKLVGLDEWKVDSSVKQIMDGEWKKGKIPDLWDGKAATRIVDVLEEVV